MITERDRQNFYNGVMVGTVLTLFLVAIWAGVQSTSQPDVHFSWTSQECVKVVNYGDAKYTCDNLPKRYNHIWVK